MAEATIDELQIEISASSASAAGSLDDLAKSLDRLQAATSRITSGSDGLNKVAKQIEKLNAISQKIQSMHGFEKLGKMVDQLSKLDRLSRVGDISGFVRNANRLPQAVNALAQMPSVDPAKFQQLADALKPLQTVNSSGINSLMNALRKLPKVSQELAGVDFTRLTQQIEQISRAIEPLARQAERSGQGLTAIAQIMQQTNRTARQSTDGVSLFNRAVGDIKVKTLAAVAALRRLFSALKSGVTTSAAYVENLNLFSVTMGESADEALRFAENVNAALGVDTSDWIRYQGVFQSIGKGFGIISEKADVMSKNLTQLTYDVSSFYNISVDTAAMKLQSAMSGQVMPMRELGFAIEETTLKQVALNHGIEMSVENMTQAQKAQLRYIAIMEQAGNIGVLGDMARTIDTASNGMRVFQARIQQFSRAVGNMLMPILSTALPYMTAFVQVLTEGAQAIANFFGFELPKIDFSDAQVSSGFDDITGAIDEATEANEKFKGSLASIDQLNIIGSDSESKNAANMGNQFDLGITLPEYDFLQGVESKTKQIAENIKDWFKEALPWIEAVGVGLTAAFASSKIGGFITAVGNLYEGMKKFIGLDGMKVFTGIAGGLAAGATSGTLLFNGIKNLITGTGKLANNFNLIKAGVGVAGIALSAFIAMGNPVGAVVTVVGAAVGALAGVVSGLDENIKKLNDEMAASLMFNNGGTKISEIADAFDEWAGAATAVNQQTIDKYNQLDKYDTKIDSVLQTMQEIAGIDINPTALTPEEAENLRKPFSDLCTYLETDFKKRTQTVAANLKDIFTNLGLGEIVSSEIGQAYADMQELFSRNLTESQTVVDNYLKQISEGNPLTELQQLEFAQEYSYVTGRAKLEDESYMNVQKALSAFSELDLSKIDFESDTTAQDSLQKILDSADAYTNSALERYNAEIDNLDKLRAYVEFDYSSGKLTDTEYRSQLDLIDFSQAVFAENLNKELNDVQSNIEKVLSPLDKQLFDVSSLIEPTFTQALAAVEYAKYQGHWLDMGEYSSQVAQEIAQGDWLENNPAYQKVQDIKKFVGETQTLKIKTELPIENQYSDTFALLKKAMDGEQIDLNLVPKIVEPVDNDKIYDEVKKTFEADTNVDWSNSVPTAAVSAESTNVGYAREAYENGNISTSNSYDSGNLEATIPVTVQVFLDNDMIMESISEQFANASYRNNGKPLW